MEMKLFLHVTDPEQLRQLEQLLILADREFIPPLSARTSTTQGQLKDTQTNPQGIREYFETMARQPMVLALEGSRIAGFMAFRFDHVCEEIPESTLPNLYASTCVVHPDHRGQGLMRQFYETMIQSFPDRGIYTRTWSTNTAHLRILDKLGFRLLCRLENHRGPGLDTVYYGRKANP